MPVVTADPASACGRLRIVRGVGADAVTLAVCGEIDLQSVPALNDELDDAERSGAPRVVLDLARLSFMDSTGLRLLMDAQARADSHGRQLVLRHVPAHAERLFRLIGLDRRLTVE